MNIVILTSEHSPYAPVILERVVRTYGGQACWVVLIDSPKRSPLKKMAEVLGQAGVRYTFLKSILFLSIRVHQRMGRYPSLRRICGENSVRIESVSSVRSPELISSLKLGKPDLILSVLVEPIIPRTVIDTASIAAVNFHPAPLPKYAGVAPVFWALSRDESETGVALHHLTDQIDGGDLISMRPVPVKRGDSVHSLYLRCCDAGSELILDAIADCARGVVFHKAQSMADRSYFCSPTKEAYRALVRAGHSLYAFRDLVAPVRIDEA